MIDESPYHELLLERLKFAATQMVSREFMHGTHVRVVADRFADRVLLTMTKEVLAHRLLADEAQVPVVGKIRTDQLPRSVMVELPNGWVRRLLRRPTRKLWCDVVGDAAYRDLPDEIEVRGTATVRATYFRTFPEAQFEYPHNLGAVRMLVQASDPYDWNPEAQVWGW